MRILTTTVSGDGMRGRAHDEERIEAARAIVSRARSVGAAMVVLPAGLLRAARESEVARVAAPLTRRARSEGVAIALGVDTCARGAKIDVERGVARGALPFFVVAAGTAGKVGTWRQRSTSGANGARIDDAAVVRRAIRAGDREIDVLACGEVFNPRIRGELGPWAGRVIVAPSHGASGARFWAARRWAEGEGAKIVRAVHASEPASVVEGEPAWDDGPHGWHAWIVDV